MSFVSLGGDGSTRPTFFELVAAEKLMPSLKAATVYSLSVHCPYTWLHSIRGWLDRTRSVMNVGVCAKETYLPPTAGL